MIEVEERFELENDGIRVKEQPLCLLCGRAGEPLYHDLSDRLGSAPGRWAYKRCPKDGLVWLDPQPYQEEILKLYCGYDITHTVKDPAPKRFTRLRKAIRQGILATAFGYKELGGNWVMRAIGRICSWIGPLRDAAGGMVLWLDGASKGRLLDVGCGNGENVAYLQKLGWQVTGVEPDPEAANLARDRFGLEVRTGSLEEAGFPAEYYDAITMAHVVEHLADPIGTLTECWRVLKPGGRLIIITPNTESLGHRIFGEAWLYLDPPRHLNICSWMALKACVEKAGFQAANIKSTERNTSSVWMGSRVIHQDGKLSSGKLPAKHRFGTSLGGLGFLMPEYLFSFFIKSGEELVLKATK